MKFGSKLLLVNLMCFTTIPAVAQLGSPEEGQNSNQSSMQLIKTITNWAAALGYDVTKQTQPIPSTELVNYADASWVQTLLFSTYFGSIPITSPNSGSGESQANKSGPFVPQDEPGASSINSQANATFKNFTSPGENTSATASALIDQPPFQADPVSQSVLNILGTPDVSYCLTAQGKVPTSGVGTPSASTCPYLTTTPEPMSQNQVMLNVIGEIPSPADFFSFATNKTILPQLNSNTLIGPLAYDTQSSEQQNKKTSGLVGQNQLQQAVNFIRYVSGSVNPTLLPSYSAYQYYYAQALNPNDADKRASGQAVLSSYLTTLRTYTAMSSVGLGNLYYILSKRIPQQKPTGSGSASSGGGFANISAPSQALNEYNMATWRLYNPSSGNNNQTSNQWIDKINKGSPAAVQKEIAILLSEINYQLYLNRQIEERMLMTSSVSLLQGAKAGQPSSDLSNQNTRSSTNTAPATVQN